jgi:hypothetical protein
MTSETTSQDPKLEIRFHGRVIEHLGIDMYQSAVAAIAELVSNAWDAEANKANVSLPTSLAASSEIKIEDDGDGMTLGECQERFLQVGYNRRVGPNPNTTRTGRPVMGRKGIGKFAGFGIATKMQIATVSRATGEKTVFSLDVNRLLGDGAYVDNTPMEVDLVSYQGPNARRKAHHGTTVTLAGLTIKQTPNEASFARSMSRRFLLLERAAGFVVTVNSKRFEDDADSARIEFDFPRDYAHGARPAGLEVENNWGVEMVDGHKIRWRFVFYKDTISEEDFAGVAVFSHGKLAQKPFHFQLSGGLGGQQALPYLSGSVVADFIDEQDNDLISTERQRINWEADAAQPLLVWGQTRIKSLLRLWQRKRSESRSRQWKRACQASLNGWKNFQSTSAESLREH